MNTLELKTDGTFALMAATESLPTELYCKCVKGFIYKLDSPEDVKCWGVPIPETIPELDSNTCKEFSFMQRVSHGTTVRYWYDGHQWRLSTSGALNPVAWSHMQRDSYENLFMEHYFDYSQLKSHYCYYLSIEDPSLSSIMPLYESKVILWGMFNLQTRQWITNLDEDTAFPLHNNLIPIPDDFDPSTVTECLMLRKFNGTDCRCVRVNTEEYMQRKSLYVNNPDAIMKWCILYVNGINPSEYARFFPLWQDPFAQINAAYERLFATYAEQYITHSAPKFIQNLAEFNEESFRSVVRIGFLSRQLRNYGTSIREAPVPPNPQASSAFDM